MCCLNRYSGPADYLLEAGLEAFGANAVKDSAVQFNAISHVLQLAGIGRGDCDASLQLALGPGGLPSALERGLALHAVMARAIAEQKPPAPSTTKTSTATLPPPPPLRPPPARATQAATSFADTAQLVPGSSGLQLAPTLSPFSGKHALSHPGLQDLQRAPAPATAATTDTTTTAAAENGARPTHALAAGKRKATHAGSKRGAKLRKGTPN